MKELLLDRGSIKRVFFKSKEPLNMFNAANIIKSIIKFLLSNINKIAPFYIRIFRKGAHRAP